MGWVEEQLAWEALVRRHQGRIYGLCFHYLGDAEDARDARAYEVARVVERLLTQERQHGRGKLP